MGEKIFDDFKGKTDNDFFSYIVGHAEEKANFTELSEYKKKKYAELFSEVTLVTGFSDFISFCKESGIRTALTTSATKRDLELAINKFNLQNDFTVIITGEDTSKHKPDPEPYIKTLQVLKINPDAALVIEDSPNGIISSKKAGCYTVGIINSFPRNALEDAGADTIVQTFHEIMDLLV